MPDLCGQWFFQKLLTNAFHNLVMEELKARGEILLGKKSIHLLAGMKVAVVNYLV